MKQALFYVVFCAFLGAGFAASVHADKGYLAPANARDDLAFLTDHGDEPAYEDADVKTWVKKSNAYQIASKHWAAK